MTVTILCAVILVAGVALCFVLAEPWQRPRYDRAIESLEEVIAAEMNREARQ